MFRIMRIVCVITIVLLAIPYSAARAAQSPLLVPVERSSAAAQLPANCEQMDKLDPVGGQVTETILTCIPEVWNGALVVFAHGYVFDYPKTASPTLPVDQILSPDGTWSLPGLVNALGFGFAMTSYTKNGLAVKEGIQDTLNLVSTVQQISQGKVQQVYVIGASEGGLIAALLIEKHPEVFSGGMAVCGPLGDFQRQINYWGDFRAVFDTLFPTVLPDDAILIPENPLMSDWIQTPSLYQQGVVAAMMADQPKAMQMLKVTGAAIDLTNVAASTGETVLGLLSYNVLATNEARVELGNIQPYDNTQTVYAGADLPAINDAINLGIHRYAAEGEFAAAMLPYQATGALQVPLVVMHNEMDPIVPFWHQLLYTSKVVASGSYSNYSAIPIPSYGHCKFKAGQQLYAFARMLQAANHRPVPRAVIQAVLVDPEEMAAFDALNAAYGDVTNYRYYLPAISQVMP